ncbi:MAG: hypothetical protein WBS24_16890 [Terriglobales bacterium]
MGYILHRTFCSTPGELELERQAFHEVVGQVNEAEGMSIGHLFVPVSIVPNMVNKLAFQPIIEANVQTCEFFVQVLRDTWGPLERNFECDYNVARRQQSEPDSPVVGVAVFFKTGEGFPVDPRIMQLRSSLERQLDRGVYQYVFDSLDDFKQKLREQLSSWARMFENQSLGAASGDGEAPLLKPEARDGKI